MSERSSSFLDGMVERTLGNLRSLRTAWRDIASSARGVLSGAATSIGSTSALSNPMLVTQLENQAIDGAVESALRGAAQGFAQAMK